MHPRFVGINSSQTPLQYKHTTSSIGYDARFSTHLNSCSVPCMFKQIRLQSPCRTHNREDVNAGAPRVAVKPMAATQRKMAIVLLRLFPGPAMKLLANSSGRNSCLEMFGGKLEANFDQP